MLESVGSYRLVIFDWDGTLVSSIQAIVSAVQRASETLNLPVPDHDMVSEGIGMTPLAQYLRMFGDECSISAEVFLNEFRKQYYHNGYLPGLLPGVRDILFQLKNKQYFLAIATGMSRRGLDEMIELTELLGIFDATQTADDGPSKPNPAILQTILTELELSADEAVMIGDSVVDMQAANAIGMDCIAVTSGVNDAEKLKKYNPVAVLDSVAQL